MAMPDEQKVLRRIIRENPCSLRRLAAASGVRHSNLLEAKNGTRPVSQGMAEKLIAALRKWADTCNRLADDLEAAME
jgi:hypothetical protein